jgi:hypothetical protein
MPGAVYQIETPIGPEELLPSLRRARYVGAAGLPGAASIPHRFGALDRDHARERQRIQKDDIAAAARWLARRTRWSIVPPACKPDMPPRECRGYSNTSWSLSAIRPSSGRERAFIFRIALLRWTFTVASAMPISLAICLLRRPRATVQLVDDLKDCFVAVFRLVSATSSRPIFKCASARDFSGISA